MNATLAITHKLPPVKNKPPHKRSLKVEKHFRASAKPHQQLHEQMMASSAQNDAPPAGPSMETSSQESAAGSIHSHNQFFLTRSFNGLKV